MLRRLASLPLLLGGLVLLTPHAAAQNACSRLETGGVRPGMTADEVHDAVGDGAVGQVVLAGATRTSVEDFSLKSGFLHVEYDRPGSRGERRVVLVRQALAPTEETAAALVKRFGEPIAGGKALADGLQTESAIWIDAKCDA